MLSILINDVKKSVKNKSICNKLSEIIDSDMKLLVLPFAFPSELDEVKLDEFIDERLDKYQDLFINFGIKKENIYIANCYRDTKEKIKNILNDSDILYLPGGNPEMLYHKIVNDLEMLYDIKYYDGIILGESAGAVLQFDRYFITKENNYYDYEAFYEGFGNINNFLIDVHTHSELEYINNLKKISHEYNKNIYALYDDGMIVYNKNDNKIKVYGDVKKI